MLRKLMTLTYLNTEDKILKGLAGFIAYMHFRATPNDPTEDILGNIIIERLVRLERRIEISRHKNFRQSMEAIGEDYKKYE